MAPECAHNKQTGPFSDIWSLGVILYQFYCGVLPFWGGSEYLIFLRSVKAQYCTPDEEILPVDARELIERMIKVDPEERPSIEELIASSYFDEVKDLTEYPMEESKSLDELWEIRNDLIKRQNVHKLEPQPEFEEQLWAKLSDIGLSEPKIDHFTKIAMQFVFDAPFFYEGETAPDPSEHERAPDSE